MKAKKIHAAAFFADAPPVYRAGYTRAGTAAGMQRAASRLLRDLRAAFPASTVQRSYVAADNTPPPASFLDARDLGILPRGLTIAGRE